MTEELKAQHQVPSDLSQLPIVWRYELLKYLRSWRLYASMIIVVAIMALLYLLPPLLGESYSGMDTRTEVWVTPPGYIPGVSDGPFTVYAFGAINRSLIDVDSLVVYMDGAEYPSAGGSNWVLNQASYGSANVYTLVFFQNVSGSEITATYEWYISPESFESLFLNFATFLVVICVTFFGADAIVSEFQNRTGYLVFPNPMKRSVLFLGKFGASLTAGLIVLTLFYGLLAALSFVSARGLDDDFILSFAYAAEYLVAAMAVAYLISSVLKGSTGALVLTFFMFLMILPIIDSVSSFSGVKIEGSLTFSSDVITYILTDPYPVDAVQDFGVMSFNVYYPDQVLAALTMAAYALVSLGIGMFLFNRKQLAG
jgi:ABC-2 type transport system permease protein